MTESQTPRLAPLTPPYAPEVAEDLERMMPPGMPPIALFRTLAHNPRVLHKIRLGNLLDRGSISLRERELVILRTTARCDASYEWGVHVAVFARKAGFTPEQIAAVTRGPASAEVWSPKERVLLRLVDQLFESKTWSAPLFTLASTEWTAEQLVELAVLTGYYVMISGVVNAFQVEGEAGAPVLGVNAVIDRTG